MMSSEQVQKVKTHLLDQLENFPEDQRKFMKHKILSMTDREVEEFIKQNELAHLENSASPELKTQPSCIFCNILSGKIPSYKIYEDVNSIGILEINPLSRGHSLLVPKLHLKIEDLQENILEDAKKIAKLIQEKYNPLEIKMSKNNILGHSLIEIIPLYGNEKERIKADAKELEQIQRELTIKETKPEVKVEIKAEKNEIIKLKPRKP